MDEPPDGRVKNSAPFNFTLPLGGSSPSEGRGTVNRLVSSFAAPVEAELRGYALPSGAWERGAMRDSTSPSLRVGWSISRKLSMTGEIHKSLLLRLFIVRQIDD